MQTILENQYAQYRMSRDSIELVNQKYHDLKHQIAALRAESDAEVRNRWLDEMEEDILAYEAQNKTGNTVLDTVLMGTTRTLSPFAPPRQAQVDMAMAAMERVGVTELAERNFAHLSGGEQQLVLIARAIAQQSDILIMDEPTSALDYGNQLRILQQVRALSREGYTVLLSTHTPQHALTFADRVLALHDGAVAANGSAKEVLTPELIRRLYRVEATLADTAGGIVIVPLMEVER